MSRSVREQQRKRGERLNTAVAVIAFAIVIILVLVARHGTTG